MGMKVGDNEGVFEEGRGAERDTASGSAAGAGGVGGQAKGGGGRGGVGDGKVEEAATVTCYQGGGG